MRRRRTKYGARETRGFASKIEADRYDYLYRLQLAGEIAELEKQPKFVVSPDDCAVVRYTADFAYRETATGQLVAEDCKGFRILPDASVRMRFFCWRFPQFELRIVRRERGQWSVVKFGERRRRAA